MTFQVGITDCEFWHLPGAQYMFAELRKEGRWNLLTTTNINLGFLC
jgi:hypothetical protein